MFWCETIRPGQKYCTCSVGWKTFRIINVDVQGPIFNLSLTPQYGKNEVLLIYLTSQEDVQNYLARRLNFDLKFQPYDHVKIDVRLGLITVVGEVVNSPQLKRGVTLSHNFYPINCPFGVKEWDDKARLENHG